MHSFHAYITRARTILSISIRVLEEDHVVRLNRQIDLSAGHVAAISEPTVEG